MKQIICEGINENKLPYQEFVDLFVQECNKEGTIVSISHNNLKAKAIVVEREK